jgi:2-(1,2-epoxy-1,2-dihydrophenyl)acetyl-CoA isomerase
MDFSDILFDVRDGIATLTLNRPQSLNALSRNMAAELGAALEEVKGRAGKDIKVLILAGAGRAFCAGGDVKAMHATERSAATMREHLRASHHRMHDLMNVEVPVVALVHGPAAGAGANIALAADFVLATPKAMFMQAFGRIGLVPDWGGFYILPRLVGLQKAKELVFTARKVGAEEAKAMGLVHDIIDEDGAMDTARAFAKRFTHASTTAIGIAKNILNQSFNLDLNTLLELEASGQGSCVTSEFHREAVKRFADKRPALFDWEHLATVRDL